MCPLMGGSSPRPAVCVHGAHGVHGPRRQVHRGDPRGRLGQRNSSGGGAGCGDHEAGDGAARPARPDEHHAPRREHRLRLALLPLVERVSSDPCGWVELTCATRLDRDSNVTHGKSLHVELTGPFRTDMCDISQRGARGALQRGRRRGCAGQVGEACPACPVAWHSAIPHAPRVRPQKDSAAPSRGRLGRPPGRRVRLLR